MKWAILLGSPDINGGNYVIFEHAVRAGRRGVEVCIITEERVDESRLFWHPEARELCWKTFDEVKDEEFDVAVATWWPTVYRLHRVMARTYVYFVQSIESRFFGEEDFLIRWLVDATYLFPLRVVTEVGWVQEYLKSNYGRDAALVRNGIRKDIYTPDGEDYAPRMPGRLRVLVEGALKSPIKNVERTIDICRSSKADEVWLLTPTPVESYPAVDRVFSNVPIFETTKIYRSCDVLVKLSYVEGMFGPPLEMFHCGGTAIVYDVTGHDEYIRHDQNALVARMDDERQVIEYINQLKADPKLLSRLKEGALQTAKGWRDWSSSSLEFEQAMSTIAGSEPVGRDILERHSKFFMDMYSMSEGLVRDKADLQNEKTVLLAVNNSLNEQKAGLQSELNEVCKALDASRIEQTKLHETIAGMRDSLSWRLTNPLRRISKLIKGT